MQQEKNTKSPEDGNQESQLLNSMQSQLVAISGGSLGVVKEISWHAETTKTKLLNCNYTELTEK